MEMRAVRCYTFDAPHGLVAPSYDYSTLRRVILLLPLKLMHYPAGGSVDTPNGCSVYSIVGVPRAGRLRVCPGVSHLKAQHIGCRGMSPWGSPWAPSDATTADIQRDTNARFSLPTISQLVRKGRKP